MCLLGSRWWTITFRGPKSPETPILGGRIGISSQICEKIQIAISSDLCIRLTWNLTGSCDQQQRIRGWSRMVVKQFQDGGLQPFWKSIYRHISVKKSSHFHEILYTAADFELNERHVIKNEKSCIGQTPSSTKRISCFEEIWRVFRWSCKLNWRGVKDRHFSTNVSKFSRFWL